MMSTQSNSGGSSVWWVIGIVMLPVGAILWAGSQQPVEDVVSELAARPFAAAMLEENEKLSGREADDLSAMNREEIGAAHAAISDRLHDSAERELAQMRLGMAASVAAFCVWCIGILSFLLSSGGPRRAAKEFEPDVSMYPGAGHAKGLAVAGF